MMILPEFTIFSISVPLNGAIENPEITEENPEWLQFAFTSVQETADNKTG